MTDAWKAYTDLLIQAELMLKEKQDEFQIMVLADQDKFREDVKQFVQLWEEYKETASKDAELTSIGLYNITLTLFSLNIIHLYFVDHDIIICVHLI